MTTRKLQENRNRERVVKQRNWNAPMNEFGVNDFQKLYKINFKLTVDIVQLVKHQALSRAKRCVQPKWHGLNVQNCRKCKYYSSLLLRYVQASCVCVCRTKHEPKKSVRAQQYFVLCVPFIPFPRMNMNPTNTVPSYSRVEIKCVIYGVLS